MWDIKALKKDDNNQLAAIYVASVGWVNVPPAPELKPEWAEFFEALAKEAEKESKLQEHNAERISKARANDVMKQRQHVEDDVNAINKGLKPNTRLVPVVPKIIQKIQSTKKGKEFVAKLETIFEKRARMIAEARNPSTASPDTKKELDKAEQLYVRSHLKFQEDRQELIKQGVAEAELPYMPPPPRLADALKEGIMEAAARRQKPEAAPEPAPEPESEPETAEAPSEAASPAPTPDVVTEETLAQEAEAESVMAMQPKPEPEHHHALAEELVEHVAADVAIREEFKPDWVEEAQELVEGNKELAEFIEDTKRMFGKLIEEETTDIASDAGRIAEMVPKPRPVKLPEQ